MDKVMDGSKKDAIKSRGVLDRQQTFAFGSNRTSARETKITRRQALMSKSKFLRGAAEKLQNWRSNFHAFVHMLGVAWRLNRWAVRWMLHEYAADYWKCIRLLLLNGIWVGFFDPLITAHIFDVAIPGMLDTSLEKLG